MNWSAVDWIVALIREPRIYSIILLAKLMRCQVQPVKNEWKINKPA